MRISPEKRATAAAAVQGVLAAGQAGAPVARRALQSLVGRNVFLARACRWGFTSLQGLFDACTQPGQGPVSLGREVLADLADWASVLAAEGSPWDGVCRRTTGRLDWVRGDFLNPDSGAVLFTDASGSGYGAAMGKAKRQGLFSVEQRQLHVAWCAATTRRR
jgi:hypothetical protein